MTENRNRAIDGLTPTVGILLAAFLLSGCSVFKPPAHSANGPTVPTGTYQSSSEKWADEALAAQRKAEKAKTDAALKKLDR